MPDASDTEIPNLIASTRCGAVVAAAGCGKTEQVSRATQVSEGRRLILTHTHAGVEALRRRLQSHNVPGVKYHVDTIAGWCLRYAASFPKRSGLSGFEPHTDDDWARVYSATAQLLKTGAAKGILASSYSGAFVDEYQDCSTVQHEIIKQIACDLPTCVFGDPLQAIFDFKDQRPVDWATEVFPSFAKVAELTTPWRWQKAGNDELANWLAQTRCALEAGGNIELGTRPPCVKWEQLPTDPRYRQGKIIAACKTAMGGAGDGHLVVIGDAANLNSRASLAQSLAALGFTNIEPVNCKSLYSASAKIGASSGPERLVAAMDFVGECMIGAEKSAFLQAIESKQAGGRKGAAKFGALIDVGLSVLQNTDEALLELLDGFHQKNETRLYRREMFFAMRSALRMKCSRGTGSLDDAIWEVQNGVRHSGRHIGKRGIGSTLLVKGLEFDHSVIVHANNMSRKDWYVALTRATTGVTILSENESIAW